MSYKAIVITEEDIPTLLLMCCYLKCYPSHTFTPKERDDVYSFAKKIAEQEME